MLVVECEEWSGKEERMRKEKEKERKREVRGGRRGTNKTRQVGQGQGRRE
jgi:hypothetical protein